MRVFPQANGLVPSHMSLVEVPTWERISLLPSSVDSGGLLR